MTNLIEISVQQSFTNGLTTFDFDIASKENVITSEKDKIIAAFLRSITSKEINSKLHESLSRGGRVTTFYGDEEFARFIFTVGDLLDNQFMLAFISALEKNPSVEKASVTTWRINTTNIAPKIDIIFKDPKLQVTSELQLTGASTSRRRPGMIARLLSAFQKEPNVHAFPAPKAEEKFLSRLLDGVSKIEKLAGKIEGFNLDTQPIRTSIKQIEVVMGERFVSRSPLNRAVHDLEATGNIINEYVRVARSGDEMTEKVILAKDAKVQITQLFQALTAEFGQTASKALEPLELSAKIGADVLQQSIQSRLEIK